jgi:peroxiredoxin
MRMTAAQRMPGPGGRAPDFALPRSPDDRMRLSDLRGAPVVLAFYPADWSPVCSDQMALYQAAMPEFASYGARLVGVSVDGVWCHKAFAQQRGIEFPLLSDFEPKGEVARRYGSYTDEGTAARSLFVVDHAGVIAWNYLSPADVNPGADGVLDALAQLVQREAHT